MRYERQEAFSKIGKINQEKLKKASITILGIGALGTTVLEILARAGIGKIKIIDRDIIELNNLQRQKLFTEADINKPKVTIAKDKIKEINSEIEIESHFIDLDNENSDLLKSDLILDCTDNIQTRFLINDYSKKNNIPWIYSSVIEAKGGIMVITEETPCFSCIFQEPNKPLETCDTTSVLGSAPSAIAAIQATEAIKLLTNQNYCKDLIHYNIWNNKLDLIKIKRSKSCKTCNGVYDYLEGLNLKRYSSSSNRLKMIIRRCKTRGAFESIPEKNTQLNFKNIISKYKPSVELPILIMIKVGDSEVTCYKNGKLLIRDCKTEEEAREVAEKVYGIAK